MTAFDQLVIRIENSIRTEENQDSSMRILHLEIFQQLKMTPLPHETSGRQFLGGPGREEQIRIEFIQKAQKIGAGLAVRNFAQESLYSGRSFFLRLLQRGLEAVGRKIGADYACKLYPELRRLRDNGEKPPQLELQPARRNAFYQFTVKNYGDRYELEPVTEIGEAWQNSIQFDDKRQRYIEEFTFNTLEKADAMHGAWERFIAKKGRCPVAYCLTVKRDASGHYSVSSISHVPFVMKENRIINQDGSSSERRIFSSVFEAEQVRAVLVKQKDDRTQAVELEHTSKNMSSKKTRTLQTPRLVKEQSRPQTTDRISRQSPGGRTV